jgi:hypothetical protein
MHRNRKYRNKTKRDVFMEKKKEINASSLQLPKANGCPQEQMLRKK